MLPALNTTLPAAFADVALAGALVDAPVAPAPAVEVCSVTGTLMETVGWMTDELPMDAPVGATLGAVPLETTGATTTGLVVMAVGRALVALALLTGKLADAMRLAVAGAAGA